MHYFCRKTWVPGIWLFRLRASLPRVKVTRVYLHRGNVTQSNNTHIITQGKITIGKLTRGKSIITQGKDNLTGVDISTWGNVTLCRVVRGKFDQFIITQGKDKVTQGEYSLGRYKYPGKVTHGRVNKGKINQGIITQLRIWFPSINLTCIDIKPGYGCPL